MERLLSKQAILKAACASFDMLKCTDFLLNLSVLEVNYAPPPPPKPPVPPANAPIAKLSSSTSGTSSNSTTSIP